MITRTFASTAMAVMLLSVAAVASPSIPPSAFPVPVNGAPATVAVVQTPQLPASVHTMKPAAAAQSARAGRHVTPAQECAKLEARFNHRMVPPVPSAHLTLASSAYREGAQMCQQHLYKGGIEYLKTALVLLNARTAHQS